jgi:HK97 family phage portal protein
VNPIGLFDRLRNKEPTQQTKYQLITERGNGFFAWNGKIYQSDIVRAAMRPKVKAIGKLAAKHIRQTVLKDGTRKLEVNPEVYIRFLLEEPNPYMTGQKLQEKMASQLVLNNNAFALIIRDEFGYPIEIYPIPALSAEAIYDKQYTLYLKFLFANGKSYTFPYADIIHLRQDFNNNDIFGDSIAPALAPLMEIVTTTDQGIVKAIKNSSIIRWLLKFTASMRPEDLKKQATDFAANFLSIESSSTGVAATDAKADAQQIKPDDYVPNAAQMDRTTQRIYSLFNTNKKIVQSEYDENGWNAYYEAEVEPMVIELSNEYTRKLFTRRERGFGNRILFEAANLATASMQTKLNLAQMVDRGALSANEWRAVFNLAPVDGGDTIVRRLDTVPTQNSRGGDKNNRSL